MEALIEFYTVVYDQQFSPCGSYLATADNYGRIAVFNITRAQSLAVENGTASHVIKAHKGPIYSLATSGQLLLSGGSDCIKVWAWSEITTSSTCQPKAELVAKETRCHDCEVNSMAVNNNTLYAGCGDSSVYVWDLQNSSVKAIYNGHQDYVHAVCLRPGSNQLLSASEDGSLCIWDTVSAMDKPVKTLHPSSKQDKKEFVTCISCNSTGDWMACGGSMSPCVYHMSSLSNAITLPVPNKVVTQAVLFESEKLITAGSEAIVRHWTINGTSTATVPSSQLHVFSLAANKKSSHKVLSVAGSSPKVDIFTNYGYKAFSFMVTDNKQ
ncbi:THO complex subunit 6 homolog [Dysidea avara]|uniref:THO complex subunit 6 homolog n=1 Tax=Dysidea avara TaxID=196820 RepID=UPI0033200A23